MLFDFDAMPKGNRYKLLVASVVPRPIAWVVSRDRKGVLNAAPYSFFNVFGEDPAVVAISVGPRPDGARKDTLSNIEATGDFTLSLVPHALAERMVVTAADFAPDVDELAEAGLSTVPSTKVGTPRIAESPVAMECTLWKTIPIGIHTMVLGEVKAMHIADDAVSDADRAYVDTPKLDLVGRMHGRGWYATTRDRVEFPRITPEQWEARKKGAE
jgi:flavin reductase (DIM6/NTAB) family NADH-FMN oxidoreductase RutF